MLAHPQNNVIKPREYKKFDEDDKPAKNAVNPAQASAGEAGHAVLAPSDPSVQAKLEAEKKTLAGGDAEQDTAVPSLRVPPLSAIAGVLISDWAYGKIGGSAQTKGNL